jgi:hypothetical protein
LKYFFILIFVFISQSGFSQEILLKDYYEVLHVSTSYFKLEQNNSKSINLAYGFNKNKFIGTNYSNSFYKSDDSFESSFYASAFGISIGLISFSENIKPSLPFSLSTSIGFDYIQNKKSTIKDQFALAFGLSIFRDFEILNNHFISPEIIGMYGLGFISYTDHSTKIFKQSIYGIQLKYGYKFHPNFLFSLSSGIVRTNLKDTIVGFDLGLSYGLD